MSLRFLTDEDFIESIVEQLRAKLPDLDIVSVRDVGLARRLDPVILAWAARNGRVVVTHDVSTMTDHASARLAAGLPLTGLIIVPQRLPIGRAVEDLLYIATEGTESDLANQFYFLPL